MSRSITRRLLLGTAVLSPALALLPQQSPAQTPPPADVPELPAAPSTDQKTEEDADAQLSALEKRTGGRLGVSILDTETNISLGHREAERFPLFSTYKALAAGFVLARVDQGKEKLDRRVTYGKEVLVAYSPVTEKHAGTDGMTIAELCEASITLSDNTAANLILDSFGGPPALTDWLRATGDAETRLDRREPELNEAKTDDPRDTTTPDAILDTLGLLTLGNTLSDASSAMLTGWLVACSTGKDRLRAGLPADWKVGDKTGTGATGMAADIAIVWPPERGPILAAAYVTDATAPPAEINAVFADIGKMVAGMVG
jgi:beta-lactamase class A